VLPDYSDPVWVAAQFEWSSEFTKVFGTTLEARVGLARAQVRSDLTKLKDLTLKVMDQSAEKHLINWSLALAHLALDQNQDAAKLISSLLKSNQNQVPMDAIHMTAARMLYQAGSFDGAITYYKKIPKNSDLWILAQEEMAWAYLRIGEPQNALAIGVTITNPIFKGWSGPEAYLVAAIASFRVCDYPEVIRTLERFSSHFKSRLQLLNSIAGGDLSSPFMQSLIQDIKKNPNQGLSLTQVGSRIHHVPTLMVTNRSIREWLKADGAFEQEIKQVEKLFSRSMALTGLQGQFQFLKNQIMTKKDRNFKQVNNLIQNLAKQEADQIKQTLAKMHIIEAELLTHVSIADRLLAGNTVREDKGIVTKVGTTGSQDKFSVEYKMTDELWFDEIGNYKVDVKKACQQRKADAQ
jgi:tetratricopeptide (TPR) repeat protein